MASQSMIGDHLWVEPKTVIEIARRAAGLSQEQLARLARTSQSSISEYESGRKSPTLAVVERLLEAAEAELVVRPIPYFDLREDPEVGRLLVPERLWSVPPPDCFARVQVLRYLLETDDDRIFDLSVEADRFAYYEWAVCQATEGMLLDSVDGVLLIQAWPHLNIHEVVRAAWQPAIDAATTWDEDKQPRDPGGLSARIAGEIGIGWPPPRKRSRRR